MAKFQGLDNSSLVITSQICMRFGRGQQSFSPGLEIKDKKGSENLIADHLSRLEKPTEEKRGTKIKENFPDE